MSFHEPDAVLNALHATARHVAGDLIDPDKRQMRFNEIVDCALRFYPAAPFDGVAELVRACDKSASGLYVHGDPMWHRLGASYGWMEARA
jgi:hypothetical protein